MTTLYLAWQDQRQGHWFPVGRLTRSGTNPAEYEFAYVEGVRRAEQPTPFWQVPGFPDQSQLYQAPEIFPAFRNRVMNLQRPDRPVYLSHLGIDVNHWDELTELSVSGGRGQWDRFEMFPEIVPDADGRFESRFILHGLSHTSPESIQRSESIVVGEKLKLSSWPYGLGATDTIEVETYDNCVLGCLPRYLVSGMYLGDTWMVNDEEVTVAQVNLDAPLSHRLLVDFRGRLRDGFSPMRDLPEYQPIA